MRELPIMFNTQMVQAILSGQKTVTRRPLKHKPLPKVGDVLWVRETWCELPNEILYLATCEHHVVCDDGDGFAMTNKDGTEKSPWRPSIHMSRKYARLFLKVESVTQENVLDVTDTDAVKEGFGNREEFLKVWRKIYRPDETMCHVIRFVRIKK